MNCDLATGAVRPPALHGTSPVLRRPLRIGLGALILATGAGKALDIAGFADVIRTYRFGLPDELLLLIGVAIAGLELVLGRWLLAGRRLAALACVSLALNAGYGAVLASALWRRLELDNCGCFGVFLASPRRWYSPLESLALVGASALLLWRLARR